MTVTLTATDIHKSFPRHGGTVRVLRGCALELGQSEAVAITGASGAGKSTLLNILGGLDHPTAGEGSFGGTPLDFGDQRDLTRWRAEVVGFVFQFHFLLPQRPPARRALRRRAAARRGGAGLHEPAPPRPGG